MLKFKWETDFRETEIGELPKEWKLNALGDICKDSIVGSTPLKRNSKYWDNGVIPWVTNKEVEYEKINYLSDTKIRVSKLAVEETTLRLVPSRSLIISFTASVGKVAINRVPLTANQQFISFVLKDNFNVVYYAFYFIRSKEVIESYSGATPFSFITKKSALTIPVPYPLSTEQSRIATVLSWFEDLIENKKRQNEILEKTAMTIFKSWFIDFEPFKDGEFVPSELGKIPKGWEAKPIGDLAHVRNGLSYSGKEKFEEPIDGSYVFITLNNAIEGGGFKPVYAWIKSGRIKEHHLLEEGDLIIPNTEQTKDERLLGSPGIVFFPPDYKGKKGVYSHHITKIHPFEQKHNVFLYLFLRFTREDSASFATGTGVLGMDIDNFKKNKLVVIPSKPILEKFHALMEPLFRKTIMNQKQIMVLRKVRDVLLPLLVFGKLRVEEI
jgi:type I restriction enzyme S subunit